MLMEEMEGGMLLIPSVAVVQGLINTATEILQMMGWGDMRDDNMSMMSMLEKVRRRSHWSLGSTRMRPSIKVLEHPIRLSPSLVFVRRYRRGDKSVQLCIPPVLHLAIGRDAYQRGIVQLGEETPEMSSLSAIIFPSRPHLSANCFHLRLSLKTAK